MSIKSVTPILNVSDIYASVLWFESLGWQRTFIWSSGGEIATFAGVCSGEAEVFLCKDGQGPRGTGDDAGVWMSWWLHDAGQVDELFNVATRLGYEISRPPGDEAWGTREFHLRHPDGHTMRVSCNIVPD